MSAGLIPEDNKILSCQPVTIQEGSTMEQPLSNPQLGELPTGGAFSKGKNTEGSQGSLLARSIKNTVFNQ
jgi:hypothetical protein